MSEPVSVIPLSGIPEVREGDDLAEVVALGLTASGVRLVDGDVVVVSSKIASKALGLVTDDPDRERVVAGESGAVVAERDVDGRVTRVVRAKAGPVMAAAGVDASNTGDRGGLLLLPHDPDAVCAVLHAALAAAHGVRVGVVLSDTAGRPWRVGQVDFALGAHGVRVVDDLRGGVDADGRELSVTSRALADELAAAADLVKGKVGAVPVAVVRGLVDALVEDSDADHDGGRSLVRTGPSDWFAMGRVEAVRAALGIEPGSADSDRVGLVPAGPTTQQAAVGRAVRVALHGHEAASADVGADSVTLSAETAYELGVVTARLQTALWCEFLTATAGSPAADGRTLVLQITPT